jgi:hypothetical protein
MKLVIAKIILFAFLIAINISAQQTSFQDTLLDRMTGKWILKGIIAGQEVTHDVKIKWILEHQYLQISELSREKDPDGTAAYESLVHIGWNEDLKKYACMWLDVTGGGGLIGKSIGHAEKEGDTLPFLFVMPDDGLFHTTFSYSRDSDTWQWTMDSGNKGKLKPFARLNMTRE